MPIIKLGNLTVNGENATYQEAFQIWVYDAIGELSGPDGEMPDDATIKEHLWGKFRDLRERLLKETDWLFHLDRPTEPSVRMIQYRQALRDAPQMHDDVRDIVFPDIPST